MADHSLSDELFQRAATMHSLTVYDGNRVYTLEAALALAEARLAALGTMDHVFCGGHPGIQFVGYATALDVTGQFGPTATIEALADAIIAAKQVTP